jgi:hypothetical protein
MMTSQTSYQAMPVDEPVGGRGCSGRAKWVVVASLLLAAFLIGVAYYEHGPFMESDDDSSTVSCKMPDFADNSLKLAHQETLAGLLLQPKGQFEFKATDMAVKGSDFYVVYESSWALSKIGNAMTPFSPGNVQIGDPDREPEESTYEAVVYDSVQDIFHAVRGIVPTDEGDDDEVDFRALIDEMQISKDGLDYTVKQTCISEFEFDGQTRGFTGAVGLRDAAGELYMLALCEGNACTSGGKVGRGRALLMRKSTETKVHRKNRDYPCAWETYRELEIPSDAAFHDYSALSVSANGRVAITSKADSRVWLGWLSHWDEEKFLFDPKKSQIVAEPDNNDYDDLKTGTLNFPRNDDCEQEYCNIEGVHWLNDNILVTVSGKARDTQDFKCVARDQSIHAFSIPDQEL